MKQQFKQELTEKGMENLQRNAMIRRQDSLFLQIAPNEEVSLKFDPEMIEVKEANFDGVRKCRFSYKVVDTTSDLTKYWTVSQRTSAEIDYHLAKGQIELKVKRIGEGLKTKYMFSPV